MSNQSQQLHDRVKVELVRSLFATIAPSVIMSVGFAISSGLIFLNSGDDMLGILAFSGTVAALIRVAFAVRFSGEARAADLSLKTAEALEQRFAIPYIAFALILGLFSARVFVGGTSDAHMLVVCLIVGYAAGVAAVVGLRPWIAIPSMVMAVAPSSMTAFFNGNPIYWATGAMLTALLAGGVSTVLNRHSTMVSELGQKIRFSGLARRDELTALPNRMALREWFDANVSQADADQIIAVHCLDLDGFKPVNDQFGHPTGDELLRIISARLVRIIRSGDTVARLGGDEFVIVQTDIGHADEAQRLARRVCQAVNAPVHIGNNHIQISACVGFVTSADKSEDLEQLIAWADEALYAAKPSQGTVAWYERSTSPQTVNLAA